jgi:flavin-dependent dehydrogenase
MAFSLFFNLAKTLKMLSSARNRVWDAIIIGAGPAGAFAALELSKKGKTVLLVDKATFPRTKVCGSCLNSRALNILETGGLSDLVEKTSQNLLHTFYFGFNKKRICLPIETGAVLSREALDWGLIQEALKYHCVFLPKVHATLGSLTDKSRHVQLEAEGEEKLAEAKVVLIADGLAGSSLRRQKEPQFKIKKNSKIGVGTVVQSSHSFYEHRIVYMAYGREGYCGIVRLETGELDIAAALKPSALKGQKEIHLTIRNIFDKAGFPWISECETAQWQGTPLLTRQRKNIGGKRFLILGDSAGFVEPFTGEGISWALSSAAAVSDIAVKVIEKGWGPEVIKEWKATYRKQILRRQNRCQLLVKWLKRPQMVRLFARFYEQFPSLAMPIVKSLQGGV